MPEICTSSHVRPLEIFLSFLTFGAPPPILNALHLGEEHIFF